MEHNIAKIAALMSRYKKSLIIASIGLVTIFVVVLGGIGFVVYRAGVFVKNEVNNLPIGMPEADFQLSPVHSGVVDDFVMNLASGWVQQNLATVEVTRFRDGLACIDALGGPSPQSVITHVRTKVSDAHMLTLLDEFGATLDNSEAQAKGTASCASWILSG